MSTQSVLVRSPTIIERAVKKPNLQDLKSYPGERRDNIVYLIRDNLAVLRDSRDTQRLHQLAPRNPAWGSARTVSTNRLGGTGRS